MTKLVYVDTETTGLNPDIHDVWEIGTITADGEEHEWMVHPDFTHADLAALKIGHYWKRFHPDHCGPSGHVAAEVERLLVDAVVIRSNPSFEQAFLHVVA